MRIVADTNTFLAVALEEPERDEIIRLSQGHELIAPDVLPFEVGNALTAMMKKGVLEPGEVPWAWEMVCAIPVELRQVDIPSALKLAGENRIYAYDAYFLQCAIAFRSPLITLDRRLKEVARKIAVDLVE